MRLWDVAYWSFMESSSGQFNWFKMDGVIDIAQQNGVDDFIFTFGHLPTWAALPTGKAFTDLLAFTASGNEYTARGASVPIPSDVVTAKEFAATAAAETKAVDQVQDDDLILDIGPDTARALAAQLEKAGTIVWNGPVGVFEFDQFGNGTKALAAAIAKSTAFSIAGGGDTLAAIQKYNIGDKISYISTGGGAFLEFLEGKKLPAVEVLESRA